MNSMMPIFIFLLLLAAFVSPDDDYTEDILASLSNVTVSQSVQNRANREHDEYRAAFISERLCEFDPHAWHCKKDCRVEHFRTEGGLSGKCRKASSDDFCFGMPITYPYVSNNVSLPAELTALQYYPSCWKRLAPLLCTYFFRPCGLFSYIRVADNDIHSKGDVELWAQVRAGYCRNTKPLCQEAFRANNITINVFDCADDDFYSDNCKMSDVPFRRNASSLIADSKCPKPLMFYEHHHTIPSIIPVYDSCYLPCRSSLIPEHDIVAVAYGKIVVAGIAALVFGSTTIFLCLFTDIYRTSLSIFSMTHSLLCITVYLVLWLISIVPSVSKHVDCTSDGLRKSVQERRIFDWCVAQSVLLHCFFTAATLWICAFLYFFCSNRRDQESASSINRKGGVAMDRSSLPLRPRAFFIIYFACMVYSLMIMYIDLREKDGLFGVCHIGLLNSYNYVGVVVAPPLLCLISTSLIVWWQYRRYRDLSFKRGTKKTMEHMKNMEKYAKERRIVAFRTKSNIPSDLSPTVEELQGLGEEELNYIESSLNMEKIKPEHEKYLSNAFIEQIHWSSIVPDDVKSFWEKKAAKKVNSILSDMEKQETRKFMPRDELVETGTKMLLGFPLEWAFEQYSKRQTLMKMSWVVAIVMSNIVSLVLPLGLHPLFVGRPEGAELSEIHEYLRCGLRRNFVNKSTDWIYDPSAPDGPFSGCVLTDVIGGTRIEGGIFVFLFLPCLPHILLVISVALGLAGYGGLLNVRMLRPKGISCCDLERAVLEDFESTSLIPAYGQKNPNTSDNVALQTLGLKSVIDDPARHVDSERERFASTERLNKLVIAPSPPPSCCGSEPFEDKGKSKVRRLDLIGRMNEKRMQAREIRKLQIIEAKKTAKLRETPGAEIDGSISDDGSGSSCNTSGSQQLQDNILTTASLISCLSTETDRAVVLARMAQHIAFREGAMAERHQTVLNSMSRLLDHSLFNNAMSKSANNVVCLSEQLLHFVRIHLHNLLRCSEEDRNSEAVRRDTENLLRDVCALADAIRIHTPRLHEWADQNGETTRYITAVLQILDPNQLIETNRIVEDYQPPVELQNMNDKLDGICESYRTRLKTSARTKSVQGQPISAPPTAVTQVPAPVASSLKKDLSSIKFSPLNSNSAKIDSQNVPGNTQLSKLDGSTTNANISTSATRDFASIKFSPFKASTTSAIINGPSATGDLPGPSGLLTAGSHSQEPCPAQGSSSESNEFHIPLSESNKNLGASILPIQSASNSFPNLNIQQNHSGSMPQSSAVRTVAPLNQNSNQSALVQRADVRNPPQKPAREPVGNANQQVDDIPPVDHGTNAAISLSPQTQSYSAAPHGLFTRLSEEALERRALRIQEFSAGRLYPQEIIYAMMLIGDVRYRARNRQPEEGERIIQHGSFDRVFPVRGRLTIPLRYSPTTFLRIMRFRAVTLVTALGYHYMIMDGDTDPEYNPPILPDLDMDVIHFDRMTLTRVIGGNAEGMTVVRRMQQIYRHGGRPIVSDPRNPFFSNFRKILDSFCELIGIELDREEIVPDPMPVAERNIFFEIREDEVITAQQLEELRLDMQLEDDGWENRRLQLGEIPNNERRLEDDSF